MRTVFASRQAHVDHSIALVTQAMAPGGGAKMAGLPMSELIQVIREHPQLKSRIQAIVSRADLEEAHKMAEIQRIVREAQPGAPGAP